MQYVTAAVVVLPAVVDVVAVAATVKTAVQTVCWLGSCAAWAVQGLSSSAPKGDDAWQMVEGAGDHGVVDTEVRFVRE